MGVKTKKYTDDLSQTSRGRVSGKKRSGQGDITWRQLVTLITRKEIGAY